MYTQLDEKEVIKEVTEQFLLAKLYLDPIHEKMNRQEELYRSFIDTANYPHNARVFDPRIFRVIETITPRMVANEPTGSFYPVETGDMATAHVLNALMKYDWRKADMFPKLVMFIKSMLIFGTSFGRNYWDFREKEKTRMVPKNINGRVVWTPKNKEKIMVTEFDGPNFEPLNIYDCYFDPNATSMDNMRWFIYRTFKTFKELEQINDAKYAQTGYKGYYKNLDKLKQLMEDKKNKKSSGSQPSDMQFREHRRIMLSTQEFRGKDESNPELVVLRRFTRDGWCDVVPEFDLVIREVENPYFHGELPIIYGVDYPYPGELLGMGEIEPIDRVQRAINAVLNQRLDNVQLTLRNMWKVRKNSGVDMHTLVSSPGNIITTDNMDAVEAIEVPDVTGATFVQTMNYLTSALQNGSGITDYTIGVGNDSNVANKTATGTRLIQQEANAQFKLKIQLLNNMVIKKIADQWKDLRIQYTTESQKLRIIGREDIKYMRDNTKLAQTDAEGNEVIPGDLETKTKLNIVNDEFAFLDLVPDDIQPSIVGDYDFIPSISSEQLTDPIALQENFFIAVDKVTNPNWVQGLASQGKQLNYSSLTSKVFEKLNLGIEDREVLIDMEQQPEMMGAETEGMPSELEQAPELNPEEQQVIDELGAGNLLDTYGQEDEQAAATGF